MAILNTYTFDNLTWTKHDWSIGEIISEGKFDNVENGIAISISLADTILREIGGQLDPETGGQIILNSSRIDKVNKWIVGYEEPTAAQEYDMTKGPIATRLLNCETTDSQQNTKLDSLITWITGSAAGSYTDTTIATRLNNLQRWITGSNSGSYADNLTSIAARLSAIEEHSSSSDQDMAAIKAEFGGTYVPGSGFTDSRLDQIIGKGRAIAEEIWGSDTTTGDSRIDTLVSKTSALATELFGPDTTTGTSRLSTVIDKEKELRTYLTGSIDDTYSGTAIISRLSSIDTLNTTQNGRLDAIETHDASVDKFVAATKAELGGTYVENSGFTNSRLDTVINTAATHTNEIAAIMEELVGPTGGLANSRIDKLENEILGTNDPSYEHSRLDDIELEIGGTRNPGSGYTNSRIDTIEANIGTDLTPSASLSTRVKNVEEIIGAGADAGDRSLNVRMTNLEIWKEDIDKLNFADLYALLESEYGQIVKMEYTMPFTLQSSTIDLAPGIIEVDNVSKCVSYDEANVTCLGNNIWDNAYFNNAAGISYDYQNGYYYGTAAAFKAAINTFFGTAEWNQGVKISFDFNFFDPLKSLKLVYNYGVVPITDTRAYSQETSSWRRIAFLNLQDSSTGAELPVYGIDTFFYGSEDSTDTLYIRNMQIEINPRSKDVEPMNPFNENWIITLPNTVYGATIDLQNRRILETYGHIASYNGEPVGDNWISTTGALDIGAEVVYELDEPIVHNIKIRNSVAAQGFSVVPVNKVVIKLNKNISLN